MTAKGKAPGLLWLFGEPGLEFLSIQVKSTMPEKRAKRIEKIVTETRNDPQLDARQKKTKEAVLRENLILEFKNEPPIPLTSDNEARVNLAKRLFPEVPRIQVIHEVQEPGGRETLLANYY